MRARIGHERRHVIGEAGRDSGIGKAFPHGGNDLLVGEGAESLDQRLDDTAFGRADVPLEGAVAGNGVARRAALDHADADRRIGQLEGRAGLGRRAQFGRIATQFADEVMGMEDGVDAEVGARGMARLARHRRHQAGASLVAADDAHAGRFSDEDGKLRRQGLGHVLDDVVDAEAADLLVIGKGEVDGRCERLLQHGGNARQHAGEKALHIGGAPAIEPVVLPPHGERVARPVLAVDRHDVGMAAQHVAGPVGGADRGEQVGLGAGRVGDDDALHPEAGQIGLDEIDDVQVRTAGDGVEADQPVQEFDLGKMCHCVFLLHSPAADHSR